LQLTDRSCGSVSKLFKDECTRVLAQWRILGFPNIHEFFIMQSNLVHDVTFRSNVWRRWENQFGPFFPFFFSYLLFSSWLLISYSIAYIQLRNGSAQLTSDQSLQNLGWNLKISNWLQKTISFSKLVTGKLLEILAINSNTTFRSATSRKMQLRFFDCTHSCAEKCCWDFLMVHTVMSSSILDANTVHWTRLQGAWITWESRRYERGIMNWVYAGPPNFVDVYKIYKIAYFVDIPEISLLATKID
jgi:hypothetical protein